MEAPYNWGKGKVVILHEQGGLSIPSNYWPIVLSSTIGKSFHKSQARRLEKFGLANGITDRSMPRGFLSVVNGAMEHIFLLSCIIDHACMNNQHLPSHLSTSKTHSAQSHKKKAGQCRRDCKPLDKTSYSIYNFLERCDQDTKKASCNRYVTRCKSLNNGSLAW